MVIPITYLFYFIYFWFIVPISAAGVRNDEIVISVDGCNTLGADVDAVQSMLNVPHDDTVSKLILPILHIID